jgi:hypothetical protein
MPGLAGCLPSGTKRNGVFFRQLSPSLVWSASFSMTGASAL